MPQSIVHTHTKYVYGVTRRDTFRYSVAMHRPWQTTKSDANTRMNDYLEFVFLPAFTFVRQFQKLRTNRTFLASEIKLIVRRYFRCHGVCLWHSSLCHACPSFHFGCIGWMKWKQVFFSILFSKIYIRLARHSLDSEFICFLVCSWRETWADGVIRNGINMTYFHHLLRWSMIEHFYTCASAVCV